MKTRAWFLPIMLVALLLSVTGVAAQPLPGQWQELAGTAYTASSAICGNAGALPEPNCVPTNYGGANAISAWVDGDYAPALKLFLIPRGGGHADGRGNQNLGFDLVTYKWRLLTYPSRQAPALNQTLVEPLARYGDGTPSSVHSYGAVAWMEWIRKLWSAGGIYWSQGGESSPARTWWWDADHPETPTSAWIEKLRRPGGYGTYAVADPDQQRVLFRTSAGLQSYDPSLDPGPDPETTLAQPYAIGATSITVVNATGFQAAGIFRVTIRINVNQSVVFKVTSVAGNVFTGSKEGTDRDAPAGSGVIQVFAGTSPYRQLFAQTSVGNSAYAFDRPGRKLYRVATVAGALVVQKTDLNNLAAKEVTLATTGGPAAAPNGAGFLFDAGRGVMLGPAPVAGKAGLWSILLDNCGIAPQPACQWTQHVSPDGVYSMPTDTAHGTWKKFFRHGCDLFHIGLGNANVWRVRPPWVTDTCAPPVVTVTLALTSTGSTGAGTLTGGGSYTQGSTAMIVASPEPGSAPGPVTGDPGCVANGPITMNSNKACNIPFVDQQAPTLTVTSPTENQLLKAPTPIAFEVQDNRPGVTVVVLLDGQVYSDTALNPATLTEGIHQLVIRAVDAAGNSTQKAIPFISVQCPVCPVATKTLSIATTGTGSGTVAGAGKYPVGGPVSIVATPTAESTYQGIAPPPCSEAPFPMPAADLACTVTFAAKPPPNTGPVVGLQARTWKPIPYGILGQSKHARLTFDSKRKRMMLAGGDGTDGSGNSYTGQNVFAIDLAVTSAWTRLHGPCPPAGGMMPARPDNSTWVYDAKRDRATIIPGYFGGGASGCAGYTDDPVKRPYHFGSDAGLWSPAALPTPTTGWGGDLHVHYGVVDPVTDSVYRFFTQNCGMQRIPLDGSPATCQALTVPGGGPTVSHMWDLQNEQAAIDVQGRAIYAISRASRTLVKWSLTAGKVEALIPLPATWVAPSGEFGGWEYETYLAFDSKNRVLMNPNTIGYGGTMISTASVNRGINFFHVDAQTWEWEAAPSSNVVSGNVLGYDEANNVFLFLGRSTTKQMWLYRYK